ncbi:MAG TPA: hypothetical protein VD833_04665 [Vicinamibacterales bacterium]|nr:hypothetical protein [Vicinamibacterales bacterium]
MTRIRSGAPAFLGAVIVCLFASLAAAQPAATVRVVRDAPVFEAPRGDSVGVGRVTSGAVLEVISRQGNWVLVHAPAGTTEKWTRGWIHVTALELESGDLPGERPRPPGRFMVRGFGHAGGSIFAAQDSFDAIAGSPFGFLLGGGAQVVFPNGAFGQVSVDRTRETGSRTLVSGTQVFRLPVDTTITVLPVLATVGYRAAATGSVSGYAGAGAGWYKLTEESIALPDGGRSSDTFAGYHVLGGAEFAISKWIAVAGEAQWATVPDALGETGISAVFDEDDLGGITFRVKVIIGVHD